MLLAIDTSNEYAGAALWDDHGLHGEANWYAGRQHTEQVLPQVDLLMRHVGAGPQDVAVVAVATGPGSWSGLRAGISLAKAFAVARGIPLIGVPTLDALAYGQRDREEPVLALVRLGRDRYGAAVYQGGQGGWQRTGPFQAVALTDLPALAPQPLLVGDIDASLRAHGVGATWARIAPATEHQRRAAYVAELAWERHGRGAYDDLVALEPIYLGSPVR